MSFPNVTKNFSKIFASQIIELIAMVCLAIGAVVLMLGMQDSGFTLMLVGMIILILAVIALVVAYILNIIGVSKCSLDNQSFKNALIMIIIEFALVIISLIFSALKVNVAVNILTTVQRVANLFVTYYILTGASEVLEQMGKTDLADSGSSIATTILILNICGCVFNFVPTFTTDTVDMIFFGLFAICILITYIMLIVFLAKANKAFKNA